MEKSYETKESRELRLWYAQIIVQPSEMYRYGDGKREVVDPVAVRLPIHPRPLDTGGLDSFLEWTDDEGRFQVRDIAKIQFRVAYTKKTDRPLVIRDEGSEWPFIVDTEIWHEVKPLSALVCEDEKMFRKYFLRGNGRIIEVAYGVAKEKADMEDNLSLKSLEHKWTPLMAASRFSYPEFVHQLNSSHVIREEKIRRYSIPLEMGVRK